MPAFPDPHSLARDELTSLLQELTSREELVSDERRGLPHRSRLCAGNSSTGFAMRATWSSLALTFSTPDRAGVREPRNPSPQNSSDGLAVPEPPAPEIGARRATTARSVEWVEVRRSLPLSRPWGRPGAASAWVI